ncbi:MAG: gamma-glutamyl-gamma-aminobutyrate hydrolase family protein [Acidimicrobiales bacterium]|jgi:putative glutamine amidotransferase|nr:gamma-glutamyl-gamma-aminobutyrate hydrolase family protein [Acidimicrobiales bacterium]
MMLIAVTQRTEVVGAHDECRDTLDQRLTGWLGNCGFLASPIPNYFATEGVDGLDPLRLWVERVSPDGLLLSGGDDLGADPYRDMLEHALLEVAEGTGLPVLGLCRGLQVMATWAGASLIEVTGHAGVRHQISGQWVGEVNSFHNFGVDEVPVGFEVTARADDGVIEGLRHRELAWEGWMWHPERDAACSMADATRLRSLFTRQDHL